MECHNLKLHIITNRKNKLELPQQHCPLPPVWLDFMNSNQFGAELVITVSKTAF